MRLLTSTFAFCFRVLKFRAENKDVKFVDVSYNEFIDDGLAAVKDVYKQLNLNLLSEIEQQMAEALVKFHARWKGKGSKAQLSDFGIMNNELRPILADYLQFCSQLGVAVQWPYDE